MNAVLTLIKQYLSEIRICGKVGAFDSGTENNIEAIFFLPDLWIAYMAGAVLRVVRIRQKAGFFAEILPVRFDENLIGLSSAVCIIMISGFLDSARVVQTDVFIIRQGR